MKFEKFALILSLTLGGSQIISAQKTNPPLVPTPTPNATQLAQKVANAQSTGVPRERREQAIVKLLEGQRYLWNSRSARSQATVTAATRQAKSAFQKAVELDPTLAEGYTALAELAISAPPTDIEESIMLASISIKIEPKNFGAHRILSRLYTFKSRLNNGILDQNFTQKAISEWQTVADLDPRNAEAWAFLSEFYDKTNKQEERITALRNWISSASPLETQFYRRVMGGQENLTPENASLKLAAALKKTGKIRESVELLSQLVADDPENVEAVELLREAVESADNASALLAVESLQQAVYANPSNTTLIALLAQVQARGGKIDDAAKVLRDASQRFSESDKIAAGNLQVSLGDLYADAKRVNESAAAYQTALTLRGIENTEPATDEQREFAVVVFEKMIRLYKNANRPNDVKAVIERARQVLGKDDLFADRQLISFYRENGKKADALQTIRSVRTRYPDDYAFLNLEATLLTENGKVDEAVGLIKSLMEKKKIKTAANSGENNGIGTSISAMQSSDDFSNQLFISQLYSQAGRGKEAIEAANSAHSIAQGAERKQIAKLTLATAQQMSGDFAGAENTLREILKQMPDNPIALNNLGYFLLERDLKFQEALEMIQKAVAIDPTNPSYLDSLGWAYFKLGKYADAEKHLKEALRYDASATILEHLGDVYQKQNKASDAKSHWQKALNLASEANDIARLKTKLK